MNLYVYEDVGDPGQALISVAVRLKIGPEDGPASETMTHPMKPQFSATSANGTHVDP